LLFRVYGNIARLGAFDTSLIFPGTVGISIIEPRRREGHEGRSRKKWEEVDHLYREEVNYWNLQAV